MKATLKNPNIAAIISKYLQMNSTINLSKSNKELYDNILNPIHNPSINTLYRSYTYLNFYSNELSIEETKNEEIFDDYLITKNNWKIIYIELMKNYKAYQNKDIAKSVYNWFRTHLFFPSMRKGNKYLDYKNNSIHQLISYDIIFHNNVIYNHYNKYTNENGFIQLRKNDFILKKSLFFEKELINFNANLTVIKNDQKLIDILEKILKYDYEFLNDIYLNNNNSHKSVENEVINFLLWLNCTVITFAKFLFSYISIYSIPNNNNNNKLISEFISKHNEFINFSLLINEQFNNINIIINYLNKFILRNNTNNNNNNINYFSIYKMCFNIMKKEIYDKLKNNIKIKFEKITYLYINDLFEKKENEINDINDSKTKEDSNSFEEYEDNYYEESDCSLIGNYSSEMNNKELVENLMLSIADYNINECNANLINHSELKMSDDYLNYEEIIFNSFASIINKYIEEKSFIEILNIITKVFAVQNDDTNNIVKDEINLNVIKRTKKNIFFKLVKYFKELISNKMQEELSNNDCNSKKNEVSKQNNMLNNIENKLNDQQKKDFLNFFNNEINEIKNYLCLKNNKIQISNYFCNSYNYYYLVLKYIIYCYYLDIDYYSHLDNKIIDILLSGKDKKLGAFINNCITDN